MAKENPTFSQKEGHLFEEASRSLSDYHSSITDKVEWKKIQARLPEGPKHWPPIWMLPLHLALYQSIRRGLIDAKDVVKEKIQKSKTDSNS